MRTLHRIASTLTPSCSIFSFLLTLVALCGSVSVRAQQEHYPTQPTPEELSMTSQLQAPGAAAVYLYRGETIDDTLNQHSYYFRVKVLTEAGKDRGNVRLTASSDPGDESFSLPNFGSTITDIQGRTIHSDGTVIPFTGKPFERTVVKDEGSKITEKVFSLPDVEVGSILEYSYNIVKVSEDVYSQPTWYVQQDLYTRKGFFYWKSLDLDHLYDIHTGKESLGVSFSSTLPTGTSVVSSGVPEGGGSKAYHNYTLAVHDIPPIPQEEFMPPMRSSVFRVNFYYAYSISEPLFWKDEGGAWAKDSEHFIGSPENMAGAVKTLVAPGDSDTVKLQKIYAAVMAMDNTSFSREHEKKEDKAQGLGEIKSAQDVWQRKRGNEEQITELFIALARAAGLKAYPMRVTNRDVKVFMPAWQNIYQLDNDVAIVVLDGKEQFFDPGQRDCPFGQLAWKHAGTGGLREMEDGSTAIDATTPEPAYTESTTQRIADLTLATDGTATGTIQITWKGAPALEHRQQALRSDEDELKKSIQKSVEAMIPAGLNVDITTLDNLSDYEKPLTVNFTVHGTLATVTAKRLILPSQFFEVNSKPLFPQPTRDIPVYFKHSGKIVDAMRVKFPADLQVESAPKDDAFALQKLATYHTIPLVQPGVVLMRRSYVLGTAFFNVPEYGDVKSFYDKVAADDQQPVVLTNTNAAATPAAGAKAAQ